MAVENIYITLWQKYKPAIVGKMKSAIDQAQIYQLSKHEFEAAGQRLAAGYAFNLEIVNGNVNNNIDGSAVARDLFEVLKQSTSARELMKDAHYKIILSKEFLLKIQIVK